MVTIIIAEKPDAASHIAQALAEKGLKKLQSQQGVDYWEFERGGKKHYVIAAVGHLFNLKQADGKGWSYPIFNVEWAPSFEIRKKSEFSEKYFRTIESLKGKGSDFIVACDYDNEGCIPDFEPIIIREDGVTKILQTGDFIESKFAEGNVKKWKDFEYVDMEDNSIFAVGLVKGAPDATFVKVKKLMRRTGDRNIFKITSEHGRSVHVSKNHPMLILSERGISVKKAEEVRPGDYLPILKSLPIIEPRIKQIDLIECLGGVSGVYVYGFNKVLRLMPAQMARALGVSRKLCVNWKFWDRMPLQAYLRLEPKDADRNGLFVGFSRAKRRIPAILNLDRDFGRLIGYYLAEGCIDTGGFIGFYFGPTEDKFVSDVAKLFEKIFRIENLKYRKRRIESSYGKSISPEIGTKSRIVAYVFDKIFKLGKDSHEKNVPDFILSTPEEFIAGILDGYFAGDGSSFKDRDGRLVVSCGSKSKNLISKLHLLLLKLGINSSIIYGKRVRTWYLVIGTLHEIKKLALHDILLVLNKSGLQEELEKARMYKDRDPLMLLPNFILNGCEVDAYTEHNMKYGERTSQQNLLSMTPYISRLTSGNLHFFKVLKVEEHPYGGKLYDIETEASSFVHGNGVVTHNSVIGYNILKFIFGKEDAKRMKFSTLTKQDLVKSYQEMSPHLDWPNLECGLARHILDFYYGINSSRALTLAIKKSSSRFALLSAGRVQGPVLTLVAEREKEIKAFKPTPYWQLQALLSIGKEEILAEHEADKFWKKEEAQKAYKGSGAKQALVESVEKKSYRQSPPVPFNITSLQTEAYRLFGYSPQQTLNIAQGLYTKAFISYPRTSSEKLPPQIGYGEILEALSKIKKYAPLVNKLLALKELKPTEGKRTDPAHEALHPTVEPPSDIGKLTSQQKNIYDLVVRRYLAIFGAPALRETMKVKMGVGDEKYFITGRRTLERGWIEFYGPLAKFEETILPNLKEGDKVSVKKVELLSKETEPPGRYSQAAIIKEMEKRGLGTRATRSAILQTLYDRHYISDKSIRVTDLGMGVAETLKKYVPDFVDEGLTKEFEKDLEKILEGKIKKEKVLEDAKKALVKICKDFKEHEDKIGKELGKAVIATQEDQNTLGTCINCGGTLKKLFNPFTKKSFVGCSSYSRCKVCGFTKTACKCECPIDKKPKGKCEHTWKEKVWAPSCQTGYPLPAMAQVQRLDKICEKCKTPMIYVIRKGKRPFKMCLATDCETKKDWGKKKPKSKASAKKKQAKSA